MHSAIGLVALAAVASAIPFEKRAIVYDTETKVVVKTAVVTVTESGSQPEPTVNHQWNSWTNHWGGWGHSSESWSKPTETKPPVVTVTESQGYPTQPPETEQPAPSPTQWSTTEWAAGGGKKKHHKTSTVKAPSGAKPTTYAQKAVFSHNLHRANHSAPNIQWSESLAATAQTIANSCVYAHNTAVDGGGYGQNIAAGVKADNISAVITNLFYNGEVGWYNGLYGQAQPSMSNFEHWGHFSQLVWKNSGHLGCATADCSGQGLKNTGGGVLPYFTVCNYKGAGNYANEYGQNVGSPLGHPTANWNTGF